MITSFAPFRFSTLFMHPLLSVKLMTLFSLIVAKYMSMLVCVCVPKCTNTTCSVMYNVTFTFMISELTTGIR